MPHARQDVDDLDRDFAAALMREMTAANLGGGGPLVERLARVVNGRPHTIVRWKDVCDVAFGEIVVRDPQAAYAGLAWLYAFQSSPAITAARAASAPAPELVAHCPVYSVSASTLGEVDAVQRLARAAAAARERGVPHLFSGLLVDIATSGWGVDTYLRLRTEGVMGAHADYTRIAARLGWHVQLPPPGHPEPAHEIDALRRACRHWRDAEYAPRPGEADVLTTRVYTPEALAWLARLVPSRRVRILQDAPLGSRFGCMVEVPMRLAGAPLLLVGVRLFETGIAVRTPEQALAWAKMHLPGPIGEDLRAPLSPFPSPGASVIPCEDVWPAVSRRVLERETPCAHPEGAWSINDTQTALRLTCHDCGRTHIALCWRDLADDDIPFRSLEHHGPTRARAVREVLATLGPITAPETTPTRSAELAPSRWAVTPPPPHTPIAPRTDAEATLHSRRRRPSPGTQAGDDPPT